MEKLRFNNGTLIVPPTRVNAKQLALTTKDTFFKVNIENASESILYYIDNFDANEELLDFYHNLKVLVKGSEPDMLAYNVFEYLDSNTSVLDNISRMADECSFTDKNIEVDMKTLAIAIRLILVPITSLFEDKDELKLFYERFINSFSTRFSNRALDYMYDMYTKAFVIHKTDVFVFNRLYKQLTHTAVKISHDFPAKKIYAFTYVCANKTAEYIAMSADKKENEKKER